MNVDVASQSIDFVSIEFSKEIHINIAFQSKDVMKFKNNIVKDIKFLFDSVVHQVRESGLETHADKAGFIVNRKDQQNFRVKAT